MPSLFKPRTPSKDLQAEAPSSSPMATEGGRKGSEQMDGTRRARENEHTEGSRRKRGNKETEGSRTSRARVDARRDFLRTTTKGTQDEFYTSPESLPVLNASYDNFLRLYPKFEETSAIDDVRGRDYYHLEEDQHVCMDYCGFGLFSYHQRVIRKASASFGLAYISANLPTHARYGAAEEGTIEHYIRERVMDYLNINENDYSMVFTASKGSAFKLLAESYPFHLSPKLLTVYDFESDAVNWMAECARQKGAKVMSACFKWPSLRIGNSHLKKLLQEKKKKSEAIKGLFVFPVQSRMTGAKYSYQWMSEAQQNKWHVLLDASALGPKDMDAFGLSIFRPDFIVSSFYKVFGTDPTGFGCLFIKNSALQNLQDSSRARAVGVVRIVSLSNDTTDELDIKEPEDSFPKDAWRSTIGETSSFSGPFFLPRETELRTNDVYVANNYQAKEASRRDCGNTSQTEHSGLLTGHSSDPRDGLFAVEESRDRYDTEYGAQLTKSRYYSEMRASEIEEEFPMVGAEATEAHREWAAVNEIQEAEDDDASEVRINQFLETQLGFLESVPEADEDSKVMTTIQFQDDFSDRDCEIEEGDAIFQEVNQLGESGLYSEAQKTRNLGGVNEMMDSRRDDGVIGNEEDLIAFNSAKVGSDIEHDGAKIAETTEGDADDDRLFASLGSTETKSGEMEYPTVDDQVLTVNYTPELTEVGEVGERLENATESKEDKHVVKVKSLKEKKTPTENFESIKFRIASFEGRTSFRRHTGKELSDFQEMGVLGLVQKFQSLHSGSEFNKELEGASARGVSDSPLYKRRGSIENKNPVTISGKSLRGPCEQDPNVPKYVIDARAKDANSELEQIIDGSYVNTGTGLQGLNCDLKAREYRREICEEEIVNLPESRPPLASEFNEIEGKVNRNENSKFLQQGDFSSPDTKTEAIRDRAGLKSPSVGENSTRSLEEPSSADANGRNALHTIEHWPTAVNDTQTCQHVQTSLRDRETASESGEENYITILPQTEEKDWDTIRPQMENEKRPSGSVRLLDNDTSLGINSKEIMRDCLPALDGFSAEGKHEIEHSEDAALEFLWKSPNANHDSAPAELTPVFHTSTTENDMPEGNGYRDGSSLKAFHISNTDNGNLQEWRHGRSDLRSNRTLSRDVDFEDEMFSCRDSNTREMLLPGEPSNSLAEDLALIDMQDSDDDSYLRSQYFSGSIHGSMTSRNFVDELPAASYEKSNRGESEDEFDDNPQSEIWEGQSTKGIPFKGLDLADSMGLTKLNYRVRYLINWLVNSLLKLRHPSPDTGSALVRIYGPKVKYDRGGSVSFNLFDWNGVLIQPGLVQRLADRSNISLGVGRLCNIVDPDISADFVAEKERLIEQDRNKQGLGDSSPFNVKADGKKSVARHPTIIPVVTAALGILTSFEDVYKLWCFLAKFLDADFVSKEVWRYHSLNQQTIVM